jgi:hypothetical protein
VRRIVQRGGTKFRFDGGGRVQLAAQSPGTNHRSTWRRTINRSARNVRLCRSDSGPSHLGRGGRSALIEKSSLSFSRQAGDAVPRVHYLPEVGSSIAHPRVVPLATATREIAGIARGASSAHRQRHPHSFPSAQIAAFSQIRQGEVNPRVQGGSHTVGLI